MDTSETTSFTRKAANKNPPKAMQAMRAGVDDATAPVKGVLLAPKRSSHILCHATQERGVMKENVAGRREGTIEV